MNEDRLYNLVAQASRSETDEQRFAEAEKAVLAYLENMSRKNDFSLD